ncbi:MAG: GNAT family N-acetyltransferase [Eubacteriales bacterium]
MIFIKAVFEDQINQLSELAFEIQSEYYAPITGEEQTQYILKTFQSPDAIKAQIEDEKYIYYLLCEDSQPFGYIGIQPQGRCLFLSKFYIKKEMRRRGYGREALDFLVDLCREQRMDTIWLTVNRHNTDAIEIYKKLGFAVVRDLKRDIGEGYFADDYVMKKCVHPEPGQAS